MRAQRWTRDDADELRAAIGHFVRVGRRHDVMPRAKAMVLGYLDREGDLTVADLAARAQVRHQSMRVTVADLLDEGAVLTRRSPTDARKSLCSITARGRELLNHDRDARTAWILKGVTSKLDADERALARQIAPILRRLSEPDS